MKFIQLIKIILPLLFMSCLLKAQEGAWPVSVSGSILPPHSLDLKVYGLERSEDLRFQMLLNDPVETSLLVKPRVSIEQNGRVIYMTDPNFGGETFLLNQFEPMVINGSTLQNYFSNIALVGAGGNGRGSVEVPEGFNQICLQMYGVIRDVPISNKFCVSGNFRLNQPPQIVKPMFNEKIKLAPVQNMIFSWQPMHLGSGNNPGAVEYTFEMVQLPDGVMNANDAFESSLKIYTANTMTTSLLYSQAEPVLEPHKIYSWRVTARSIMHPSSKLFQNEGRSEISVFIMYDGEEPSVMLNPADNASPRGCSVYETSYGPVAKSDNEPIVLIPNQRVKVGYFDMIISEVSGGIQGYSGKGWVQYPMLRSSLEVAFQNIKVNKENRVYEADNIEAVVDPVFHLTNEELNPAIISQNIDVNYANSLHKFVIKDRMVAKLPEGNLKKNQLPLALSSQTFKDEIVCVTGIKFTAQNAYLVLISLEKNDSNINISAATAVPSTPYGIKNGSHLVPLSSTQGNSISIMPSILKSMNIEEGSKLYCDCQGVQKKQTRDDLFVSKDVISDEKNLLPLKISLKDSQQEKDSYSGAIGALSDFRINGVENLLFNSGGGQLNLSEDKEIQNLPENVKTKLEPGSSKLLWLSQSTVNLPERYTLGSNKVIQLEGDIYIGEEKVEYAAFKKSNILSLEKGRIEKWSYSIDEMGLTIKDEQLRGPSIKGMLRLPISEDKIAYSGNFFSTTNENPIIITEDLPESLSIGMWAGQMQLDSSSVLAMEIKSIGNENTIYPYATLSGDFSMKMDHETFKNSLKGNIAGTLSDMQQIFNLPNSEFDIALSGISIENWNFEPYNAPEKKFRADKVDVSKAVLEVGGKTFPVTGAEIIYRKDEKENIGLSFSTTVGKSKISFTIWGVEKNGKFEFANIEQTSYELNCDCETGQSYGNLDYDKIYDKIIRNNWMPYLNNEAVQSGKASSTDGMSASDKLIYASWKQKLIENTDNDFVLIDNNKLYWPLLDMNLEILKVGEKITIKEPIIINEALFVKLGFKTDFNIPQGSELYLSNFTINKWQQEGAEAAVNFELHTLYNISDEEAKMIFRSSGVVANGNSIQIVNVNMDLLPSSSEEGFEVENYRWLTMNLQTKEKSHARIDCVSGLKYFKLFGVVTLDGMVDLTTKTTAEIPFETEEQSPSIPIYHSLGICEDYLPSKPDQKWKIHLVDQPQVSFKAGESYKIYIDNSPTAVIPSTFSSTNYSHSTTNKNFKGIVFEKLSYELLGFQDKDKKSISLEMGDAVYVFGDTDNGFHTTYYGEEVLDRNDGAKVSGWRYGLHDVSFTIEKSEFKYDLEFAGSISIPLFKNEPDKINSVQFDSAWVEFNGGVVLNTSEGKSELTSSFELDEIADKIFQSDFIPGLGFALNEDSNIEMDFDSDAGRWKPKGQFSGRALLLVNSPMGKSYNVPIPDGIDFMLNSIEFSGLLLNHRQSTASQSMTDEYGITSVDFGEWGIQDEEGEFEEEEEASEETTADAPVNTSPAPKTGRARSNALTKNDPRKPTATATPTRSRSNAVTKADPRRPAKTTRARSNAIRQGTAPRKDPDPVMDTEPEFNAMTFSAECTGIKAVGDKFELEILLAVSLLGDNTEKKREDEEVKTTALNAKGGLGIQFGPNSSRQWRPTGVVLNCLQLDGSIGPVEFAGGLAILRNPKDANGIPISGNTHGDGFKAFLSATISGLGGLNAVAQFGVQTTSTGDSFTYGFLDIEAFSTAGIPFPPPSAVSVPIIDLYGAGGGIRINMESASTIKDMVMKQDSKEPAVNDCNIPDAKLLAPGVGLSGTYTPKQGSYGGNFYLIMGPYNLLDVGPEPQYTLIADPGIGIEIGKNEETNELQFGKVEISINAYIQPESIMKRRTDNVADAYAKMEFNWANKYIAGEIGMRMKVEIPNVITPIIQIPENYDDTDESTKANYVKGFAALVLKEGEERFEVKFGGPSIGDYKSNSKLVHNSALFSLNEDINLKALMYFQAGADVDAPPPLEELIPQLKNDKSENPTRAVNEDVAKSGLGIAMGVKFDASLSSSLGPFSADLNMGVGFDLNLRKLPDVTCLNTDNSEIGIGGFYAIGQAYAYASGSLGMDYDLIFASGSVNIFTGNAFLYLEAMAPNPSYFKGRMAGSYSVLDGLLDGDFDYKVELGEQCEGLEPPSPLESIAIYAGASVYNGQKDVNRFDDITINTNVPLRKDYTLNQTDLAGNPSEAVNFMADISTIKVTTVTKRLKGFKLISESVNVPCEITVLPDKKTINISFEEALDPLKEYLLTYDFSWMVKERTGSSTNYKAHPKSETGSITFTSGPRPKTIADGMLEYSSPGNRQRYWHKGYADTEIKFKLKALKDAVYLFPEICSDCGIDLTTKDSIRFEYFVELKEYDNNKVVVDTKTYPITNHPKMGELSKILKAERKSIDNGRYHINYMTEEEMPVSIVSFPDLKNQDLKKSKIYELSVIRKPKISLSGTDSKESQRLKKILDENTKSIRTYCFGVSQYNDMNEKINNLEISHVKSTLKLRDFNHPSDIYDTQRAAVISKLGESKFHSVKDDYYAIRIKNKKDGEGFDKFDIMRLKYNIKMEYVDQYLPEKRISNIYNGYAIDANLSNYLTSQFASSGGNYLKKVLTNLSKEENHQIVKDNISKSGDGTKWGYNISGPDDSKRLELSDEEIWSKKIVHKSNYSTRYDPNSKDPVFDRDITFDILIQDYRSRIIINQMFWLSRISEQMKIYYWNFILTPFAVPNPHYNQTIWNWSSKNHPKGEFLSDNLRQNDFSWILSPPDKAYQANQYTFIASEPGYQFSYHGETKILFPSSNNWGKLLESKRDNKESLTEKVRFKPSRSTKSWEEFPATNATELLENSWYIVKYGGSELYVGNRNERWSTLWGVGYPYSDFNYSSSQYGLYGLGAGGWLSIRGFDNVDDTKSKYENVWNFSNVANNTAMFLINYRYRDESDLKNRNFPKVIQHRDFSYDVQPKTDHSHSDLIFIEVGLRSIHPEKYYYIQQSDGTRVKDKDGNDKFKFIREGRFFRIVSNAGYHIKGHHHDEWKAIGANKRTYRVINDETKFPADQYGDPNGYFRSVWAVIPVNEGEYHYIKNVRYPKHFLTIQDKNMELRESKEGDQLKIIEVK